MPYITTADGAEIFFKDWGSADAQPIVFHHGWPLSSDDWDAQLLFFHSQGYRVVASDRRGHYPVYDLTLAETGRLAAPYPTNIPWPSVVRLSDAPDGAWLMVAFNGRPYGGRLTGYGTHGEVVIMRSTAATPAG